MAGIHEISFDNDPIPAIVREGEKPLYRCSINHTAHQSNSSENTVVAEKPAPFKKKQKQKNEAAAVPRIVVIDRREPVTEVRMTQPCYLELMAELAGKPPEKAGMLFGPTNDKSLITHFCPDEDGQSTSITFTIDGDFVNKKIRLFKEVDMEMKGIAHSHPAYFDRLSSGDLAYLDRLLGNPKNRNIGRIYMPIVCNRRMFHFLVDDCLNINIPHFQLV